MHLCSVTKEVLTFKFDELVKSLFYTKLSFPPPTDKFEGRLQRESSNIK